MSGFIWCSWTRKAVMWIGCQAVFPIKERMKNFRKNIFWRSKWGTLLFPDCKILIFLYKHSNSVCFLAFPCHLYITLLSVLMKMGQFNHNMQQYSQWVAAALNSWPYDHVSAATHSLPGRQQTGCSCRAVTPPQAPSSVHSVFSTSCLWRSQKARANNVNLSFF